MIAIAKALRFPPWVIIVPQVIWLWSACLFVYYGLAWHSVSHFVMASVSCFLIAGLHFRRRAAFWLSVMGFAAATGVNIARVLNLQSLPILLAIGLFVSFGSLVLHQIPPSLRWFGFERHRRIRLAFWLLAALLCVVTEYWFCHIGA
jgi:hypothetical protein